MNGWMDGWMGGWMDEWVDGCMDGCMDGWLDDWKEGWVMDGRISYMNDESRQWDKYISTCDATDQADVGLCNP